MKDFSKAYILDNFNQKVYNGVNKEFTIPKNAKGYKDYIDSLYISAKELSPKAFLSAVDTVSDAMVEDVINAPDTIESTGNTYYISNNGDDNLDGLSPETAWATIDKLRAETPNLKEGDAVLFERGGEWRKYNEWPLKKNNATWDQMSMFVAKKGVSYGAYGEGEKPILNGSQQNYATDGMWCETEIPNVYLCKEEFWIVAHIAIDHSRLLGKFEEKMAHKEIYDVNGFSDITDLNRDCSYYLDADTHKLYFYSEKGNPSDRFKSMEIGGRLSIIRNNSAALIENFNFKFSGYGITGGPYMNVKGCIFSYIGGCQCSDRKGDKIPCGNAIEIYGACDGFFVENCWMYEICDTGLTHQLWSAEGECIQRNISFKGNVIDRFHWGIEFNNPPSKDGSERLVENCVHSYNIVKNGGQCWAESNFDRLKGATAYNCFGTAKSVNVLCEKNIFSKSTGPLYRMRLEGDPDIKYVNNINIQYTDCDVASLYEQGYPYDDNAEKIMCEKSDYKNGIFIYLE